MILKLIKKRKQKHSLQLKVAAKKHARQVFFNFFKAFKASFLFPDLSTSRLFLILKTSTKIYENITALNSALPSGDPGNAKLNQKHFHQK